MNKGCPPVALAQGGVGEEYFHLIRHSDRILCLWIGVRSLAYLRSRHITQSSTSQIVWPLHESSSQNTHGFKVSSRWKGNLVKCFMLHGNRQVGYLRSYQDFNSKEKVSFPLKLPTTTRKQASQPKKHTHRPFCFLKYILLCY